MTRNLTVVTLGDLHFGANRLEGLERELQEVVFPWLETNEFDAFIQLGDLYDKRLSQDSEPAQAAMRFVFRICQLCQLRGNVPCRIIKGGCVHDSEQLSLLRPLETEFSNFRIISTASSEYLLPGFKVLWIPEEYPTNYGDFYSQFLYDGDADIVYDAIFGHGEIDVGAGWSEVIEGERFYGGTPTHEAERLLQHSRGAVQFGHIHNKLRYKKRLGYAGSFSRWCQGEEDTKSFDVLKLSQASAGKPWKVEVRRVDNPLAPVYKTVRAEEIMDEGDAPDMMVTKIRAAARDGEASLALRVKFAGFVMDVETFSIVRGALVEDRNIQLQTAARAPREEEAVVLGEGEDQGAAQARAVSERHERLSYLRDQSLPAPERLLRFIMEMSPESSITIEDVMAITAPMQA
jgi:hypothetical protein